MMKKICSLIFCLGLLLSLCGCGTVGSEVIHDTMKIPADGWVDASVFKQIKEENAIVTFTGESNGHRYEWTVFGDEIDHPEKVNLGVEIVELEEERVELTFLSAENFSFRPVLSLYLEGKWEALTATVYQSNTPVCGAAITGSETSSTLNFTPTAHTGSFEILPDEAVVQMYVPEETVPQETLDSYLSAPEDQEDWVVTGSKTVGGSSGGSSAGGTGHQVVSDGTNTNQDQYLTDPIPEGKPMPVEPGDVEVGTKSYTCTFAVDCATILNNIGNLNPSKLGEVPSDGWILKKTTVTFYENESVFDLLKRVCKENGIPMEATFDPTFNSAYVEGIHNLYEFDCGGVSGWMFRVNGWYPNYGCSRYILQPGDVVEWRYTCDLGADVGCDWMGS